MATSGKELTQLERDRIARLRAAGLSVRDVAKAERVSPTTVQKILRTPIAK
jgi:IS30 family transposase